MLLLDIHLPPRGSLGGLGIEFHDVTLTTNLPYLATMTAEDGANGFDIRVAMDVAVHTDSPQMIVEPRLEEFRKPTNKTPREIDGNDADRHGQNTNCRSKHKPTSRVRMESDRAAISRGPLYFPPTSGSLSIQQHHGNRYIAVHEALHLSCVPPATCKLQDS